MRLADKVAIVTGASRGIGLGIVELFAAEGAKVIAGSTSNPAGVYPKGVEVIKEREVLTAGRTLGLTDNKVCKISETLTAVRFVIPVAARKKK